MNIKNKLVKNNSNLKLEKKVCMYKKVAIGLCAGIVSGMFGAGGGMILVPAFIYILKMEEKNARATSLFVVLPIIIASSFLYMKNDFIDWNLSIKCAIRSVQLVVL